MVTENFDKNLDMQIRSAVDRAVEKEVNKELNRIEECRKKVYRAYWFAGTIVFACIGITSWIQIPRVVASLIRQPASGQLAQVFQRGQDNASKLANQSQIAQEKIDEMAKKLTQVEGDLRQARQLSVDVTSQVKRSSGLVENATKQRRKCAKTSN